MDSTSVTTSFEDEVEDILQRPLERLATARDVPRLVKRICVRYGDVEMPTGSTVVGLCRTLVQVLGDDSVAVQDSSDEGDVVRKLVQDSKNPRLRFVLSCLNQNIISPAVTRLKLGLGAHGVVTKDSGEWSIEVLIDGDKRVQVVHTRGESFLQQTNGGFAFRWRLAVTNVPGVHALTVIECDGSLSAVLAEVVDGTKAKPLLPPLQEYMKSGYFNW